MLAIVQVCPVGACRLATFVPRLGGDISCSAARALDEPNALTSIAAVTLTTTTRRSLYNIENILDDLPSTEQIHYFRRLLRERTRMTLLRMSREKELRYELAALMRDHRR
ncbi:hypothetical protein [Nonomuraea typhae]|uniref:Uncharacterized protein n=1 Tax=Nonomuraea typhae TaxID=2603600 RepID=A0ABW7YUD0_9ACTN